MRPPPSRSAKLVLLALAFVVAAAVSARADDWPQWLGPKRDGVWRETDILDKFPKDGPKVLWRKPIGAGSTGPAVVGDLVSVMDRQRPPAMDGVKPPASAGSERVLCLNAADGEVVWKHEYDCPYKKVAYGTGPRTTPLVHGGKVYTLGTMGDLYCLDAKTGKPLWHRNFVKDFKAEVPAWGWSSHPLLVGDKLVCTVGTDKCAAMAFDRDTGKEIWRALSTEEIGCAPPTLIEAGGTKQVIIWLSESVNGLDPDTGKVFWSVADPEDGKPDRPAVNIITPQFFDNKLFVSSFYHGSLVLELDAQKPAAKVFWRSKSRNPAKTDTLHAVMSTPIVKDGHIYGLCGNGELRCIKAATGERVWETYQAIDGKKAFCGTVFFVPQGDRYFGFNDQGELLIARLTPQGYEEIDRAKLLKTTQFVRGRDMVLSHPAFANRCVYARNDEEIVCVSLAAPKKDQK
jgi:outer membrane protein assembly factor BamB